MPYELILGAFSLGFIIPVCFLLYVGVKQARFESIVKRDLMKNYAKLRDVALNVDYSTKKATVTGQAYSFALPFHKTKIGYMLFWDYDNGERKLVKHTMLDDMLERIERESMEVPRLAESQHLH